MIDVDFNPRDVAHQYLAFLNSAYGGWGDEARYRWVFERAAMGPRPDLMLLREAGEVLAGSAVSYRQAVQPGGRGTLVGIMTGSWTLPPARGRGCFTRVIEASLEFCRQRGAEQLLAFVTADNASFRRLRDAGAALLATSYWILPPSRPLSPPGAALDAGTVRSAEALSAAHALRPLQGLRFVYDLAAWRGQFIERPALVEVVGSQAGIALVERTSDTDRILALYPVDSDGAGLVAALVRGAQERGRTLFSFTGSPESSAWFAPLGVRPKEGFLAVLPVGAEDPVEPPTVLALENGDRM